MDINDVYRKASMALECINSFVMSDDYHDLSGYAYNQLLCVQEYLDDILSIIEKEQRKEN